MIDTPESLKEFEKYIEEEYKKIPKDRLEELENEDYSYLYEDKLESQF